jgi:hypothetical protein
MKNYLKYTIALLFVSSIAFTSCLDLTSNATDADASLKQTFSQSVNDEMRLLPCDYDNRKTTQMLIEQVGIVTQMANPANSELPLFVIQIPGEALRYTACNMPDAIKKDGLKITFDGERKEIFPEEKWIASPLKLTQIHGSNGNGSSQPLVTTSME